MSPVTRKEMYLKHLPVILIWFTLNTITVNIHDVLLGRWSQRWW